MTVSIEGTTPGIAVDGTGAVVNVTVTTGAGGGGGGVELGETSTTAYRGDRGKTAYDHSQVVSGNPHGTTAADVGADPAGTAAGLVDDLSGVSNQATARTNLGLGTAATAATGDFAATSHTHTGTQVTVDASGFNGNLTTTDDTVQEIAQKLDDLTIPAAGIADPGGSNDDLLQRKSGAWTYRTPAQVKTDLGVSSPVTSIVPVAVGDYLHLPRGLGSTYAAFSPSSTATNSNGHVRYVPFFVDRGITFDELALHVVAGNAGASAVLRLGIFADNAGRPGTVVADAGTASLNSTGVKSLALSPAVALTHGWYWFAVATQGLDTAGTNPTYSALQNTTTLSGGTAVQASNQPYPFLSSSGITGAFANNPTVSMNYTGQPTTYNVYGKVSALA